MRQADIDALGNAAYNTPLRPGNVRDLGKHVQVWAVRIDGYHARKTHRYLTLRGVSLCNGDRTIDLPADRFPAPGKRGISIPEFCRVLWGAVPDLTKKSRLVLMAHGTPVNYGPLDVHDLDARITYTPAGEDAYALKFRDDGVNVEFLDLAAFFPEQEPGEVAAALGITLPPPALLPSSPLFTAHRDAVLTWAIFDVLRAQLDGEFGVDLAVYRTPAACAARVYVSRYLQSAPGGTIGVRKYIRLQAMRSYWGGRAEAFARGHFRGDLSIYDAVSLYPHAALALEELPTANSWFRLTGHLLNTCRGGICTVEFEFPADELHPCLPVAAPGSLLYPRAGVSHCTVHEVRYAQECGAKIKLLSGYGYMRGDTSLAEFSRDLLAQKQAADDRGDLAARTIYKLLMNSLYGKFGQSRVGHSLETLRMVCRKLGYPSLDVLNRIPNWEALAGDVLAGGEGDPLEPEILIGGQWCPEWAALIQGYARYIEGRAMREYVALIGTTDSVVVNGDAGDEFQIEGVTFRREARGDHLVIVRSRLYVLAQGGEIQHAALHGAPKIATMPAALLAWDGAEEIKIEAERVRKLRDGLTTGNPVGRMQKITHTVGMGWDGKRSLVDDYSEPFDFIDGAD